MSFDIAKFKREYKRIHDENKELRDRLASFEPQKAADIRAAVQMGTRPLHDQLAAQKVIILGHEQNLRDKDARIEKLNVDKRELAAELDAAKQLALTLEADRDRWKEQYDTQLPIVLTAENKARDLQALLDKHRERMNRKELEAERAILNRKVIAGAAPGINRR